MTPIASRKGGRGARRTTRKPAKPEKPAKPAPKRAAARPRVSAAVQRIAEALDRADEPAQCAALDAALAKVPARSRATTAAAALGHTERGKPVARAYLAVVASPGDEPVTAADAVARYCAAVDRGRAALRGAFAATWHRASDVRVVEDAYRNFERELLDDPELLAIGVASARQLGNQGAMAERAERLVRAKRLAPVVRDLAGTAAARGRAAARLGTLTAEDRRHVHGRILEAPARYPEAVAVAAIVALVDDPDVPDRSLASAIGALPDAPLDALVAAWRDRVAGGDDALITRLLALFEWTGLTATDTAQLVPFIRALHPVGGRGDVFAQVDGALTSEQPAVREAVLDAWLARPEALAAFGDAQVETLIRSVVAIAEEGNDTPDRRAANRVLGELAHPGASRALMDAIEGSRTRRNDQLRTHLYRGVAGIDHAALVPFLVGRLFLERERYGALLDALARKLDATTHHRVLATLAARAADPDLVHAAAAYAEVLVDKRRAPRLLIDLARALAATPPRTRDDGRRLRYVFEQATAAALELGEADAARAFATRARDLPDRPYSDYRVVDRGERTPAAFGDDEGVKAQLAALDAGVLEQELAAARKARGPVAADDARLAALAGCAVASRLLDDRARHVAWFFDELGELRVYDGFGVGAPSFAVTGDPQRGMTDGELSLFVGGKAIVDERATFADPAATRVREVLRMGDRVLVFDGAGTGWIALRVLGVRFASYIAARDALARFAASPPDGTRRVEPWTSQLRREYRAASGSTARLAVTGAAIDGELDARFPALARGHAGAADAGKALQVWEGKLLAAGGRLVAIAREPS